MADANGKVMTKQGTDLYFQNLPKDKYPPQGARSKININRNISIYQSILDNCFNAVVVAFFGW